MTEDSTSWKRWNRVVHATAVDASDVEADAGPVDGVQPISGTFVGSGARFEGTLRLEGDFFIDSEFSGALKTDGKLVVGPSGAIEGDIEAREVVICGAVVGGVKARRQLILRSTAKLHGDIETACLEIEPHAFFCGTTAMTRPQDHRAEVRGRAAPDDKAAASSNAGALPSA